MNAIERLNESELLLLCARSNLSAADCVRIRELTTLSLDWDRVFTLARNHGIVPSLWAQISHQSHHVPAEIQSRFRNHVRRNTASCLSLTSELLRLTKEFRERDVPVIAFKGPVLSLALYGSCSQRQYGDLDVLVPAEKLPCAMELLERAGYEIELTPRRQRYFARHRYHFTFAHPEMGTRVELHWAFTPRYWPFPLDWQQLWGQALSVDFAEQQLPCLCPQHRLLVLCAHGTKERWARLQLVRDVDATVSQGVDWPDTIAAAQEIGRQRILLLGVALARDLLGTNLPQEINTMVEKDRTVGDIVGVLRSAMFDDSRWPLRGAELHRYFFTSWHRRRDQFGYVAEQLRRFPGKISQLVSPSQRDVQAVKLPSRATGLYFLIRPFRVVARYRSPGRMFTALFRLF